MALWTMPLLRTARGPTPTCDLANVNAFAPCTWPLVCGQGRSRANHAPLSFTASCLHGLTLLSVRH